MLSRCQEGHGLQIVLLTSESVHTTFLTFRVSQPSPSEVARVHSVQDVISISIRHAADMHS